VQGDLFPDPEQQKNKKLDSILDKVHQRHGGNLSRGMGLKGSLGVSPIAGDPDAPHVKPDKPNN